MNNLLRNFSDSTIVAVSSPPGTGAIALIRVSGKQSVEILRKIFTLSFKSATVFGAEPRKAILGQIKEDKELIDQVICTYFKGPNSFTGEDMVEINCHGSFYIQQKIVQTLIKNGCQLAAPGEFSLRAFLNGKMDLSQAEAVADLIQAGSEASHKMAMNQMRGGFSNELKHLRNQMLEFISLLELELDFSEEDVEFADRSKLMNLLHEVITLIEKLSDSFSYGNVIKNGVSVAIVGKPNVGKSTLLNALLNEEKAIVSEIAGTTRDAIEDTISIGGILFRFIDTAGLRHTRDEIESKGIEITRRKINQASIVILLLDATYPIGEIEDAIAYVRKFLPKNQEKKLIITLNKKDKVEEISSIELKIQSVMEKKEILISISAKNKDNLKQLENLLLQSIGNQQLFHSDVIVSNARHFEALNHAADALRRALAGIENRISGEFVAQDIRQAINYLGSITGLIANEEVLGNIFKNFCIGK